MSDPFDRAYAFLTRALEGDREAILLIFCGYFAAAATWSLFHQLRLRRWPATRGRLVHAETRKFGSTEWVTSEQEYQTDALYEYTVAGTPYQGRRVSAWIVVASHNLRGLLERQLDAIERHPDGSITVYYNPNKPQKSLLVKPGWLGIGFTIGLGALPTVLVWLP